MAIIVDRRLSKRSQNADNKDKFKERHKEAIKAFIKKKLSDGSVKEIADMDHLSIPISDVEPSIHIDHKNFNKVFTGNNKYRKGDTIPKPESGQGNSTQGGKGVGEDDFTYTLTKQDLDEIIFKHLGLPYLTEKLLKELSEDKYQNNGFKSHGIPSNLSVVRSFRNAIGRQAAMESAIDEEIKELEDRYFFIMKFPDSNTSTEELIIREKIKELDQFKASIPFLDDVDLRYRNREKKQVPVSKAVMFCLMDRSGSMDKARKDIAKNFFVLLALFLRYRYEKIDIVFIAHDEEAEILSERRFFEGTRSGGTYISSGLNIIKQKMDVEYSPTNYNIYIAHATDCENFRNDDPVCIEIFETYLRPYINMYVLIGTEVYKSHQDWSYIQEAGEYTGHIFMESKKSNKIIAAFIDKKEDVFDRFIKIFKEADHETS